MTTKILFFLLAVATLSLTSCGSVRSSDCGLGKSLKILNIHDTNDAKILLVENNKVSNRKNS
jgi:hypothetical protein